MTRRRTTLTRVVGVCGLLASAMCVAVWPGTTAAAKKERVTDIPLRVTVEDPGEYLVDPGVYGDPAWIRKAKDASFPPLRISPEPPR